MTTFLDLARVRRGHFQLESGLHSGLWFDLDAAFVDQAALDPFVTKLAQSLRRHDVEAVCGPLTGGAFLAQLVARLLGSDFYFTTPVPGNGGEPSPARYQLPHGTGHRLLGKRIALVDDVMSAGSSLRATLTEVETHGAIPVVVGVLYVLGSIGATFFSERGLRIETTGRAAFDSWRPPECPLCAAGVPIEDPVRTRAMMPTEIHRQVEAAGRGELSRVIARMRSGWAVLGDPQITLGYCLLLPDPVVPDLNALTGDARRQFLDDMAALGDAVLAVTGAERINYEILGNVEPALHAHVIPRHATEELQLRRQAVWLHDWKTAPPVDQAAFAIAQEIAARLAAAVIRA